MLPLAADHTAAHEDGSVRTFSTHLMHSPTTARSTASRTGSRQLLPVEAGAG
ncbi:hypothetical protein Krad_4517 (plasmid) [Kineococcus radiotolerans SRS30216 = ATCC BAA-149]|uniref:Uncharacterized protein n=1 Tax=Kineococcus radiotolerans (strain ATCC BAA-149 / DSM 14245 / SRS30216) TaxID=266940 RepID=A6WGN7_KINRD|nr:hypothetical protein Krad_4517 [Kineococcus radiotolerans SRS30216 = ATCC BAA-149]